MRTVFFAILLVTACSSEESNKVVGSEGSECYPNSTCNSGLICDPTTHLCESFTKKITTNNPDSGTDGQPFGKDLSKDLLSTNDLLIKKDVLTPDKPVNECTLGEMKCSGDYSYTCEAGKWVQHRDCAKEALKYVTFRCEKCSDNKTTDCFALQPIMTLQKLVIDGKTVINDLKVMNKPEFIQCKSTMGNAKNTNLTYKVNDAYPKNFLITEFKDEKLGLTLSTKVFQQRQNADNLVINKCDVSYNEYGTKVLISAPIDGKQMNYETFCSDTYNTLPIVTGIDNRYKSNLQCFDLGCEWTLEINGYLKDFNKQLHTFTYLAKGVISE